MTKQELESYESDIRNGFLSNEEFKETLMQEAEFCILKWMLTLFAT